MSQPPHTAVWRTRPTLVGAAGAAAGVLLFAYAVRTAGLDDIVASVRKVGSGFLLVLVCSAVRQVARTVAWTLCVDGPVRLGLRDAFESFVTGDAVGNLTPLGPLASEGTKAVFVRPHLPTMAAVSSIALENIFYAMTVAVMIAIGTTAFLYGFQPNQAAQMAGLGMLALAAVIGTGGWWLLSRQPRLLSGTARWVTGRAGRTLSHARLDWIRALEQRIYGFSARHPGRVARLLSLEMIFHAAGVAEIYVILALLVGASAHALLLAVVLETVNRVITVVFKFIPMRLGVDEAGSGLATQVLALGTVPGVTIAIIRKARVLCWTALGVWFLVRRGLSLGALLKQAQALTERAGAE
jgi:hypothetical protein